MSLIDWILIGILILTILVILAIMFWHKLPFVPDYTAPDYKENKDTPSFEKLINEDKDTE